MRRPDLSRSTAPHLFVLATLLWLPTYDNIIQHRSCITEFVDYQRLTTNEHLLRTKLLIRVIMLFVHLC
jgi:hypothetical protein